MFGGMFFVTNRFRPHFLKRSRGKFLIPRGLIPSEAPIKNNVFLRYLIVKYEFEFSHLVLARNENYTSRVNILYSSKGTNHRLACCGCSAVELVLSSQMKAELQPMNGRLEPQGQISHGFRRSIGGTVVFCNVTQKVNL